MSLQPWQACWVLAGAIFGVAKVAVLVSERRTRRASGKPQVNLGVTAAWLLLWPGMDPVRDLRRRPRSLDVAPTLGAVGWLVLGLLALAVAPTVGAASPRAGGAIAAVAIVLVLHFGALRLLAEAWHAAGRDVRPLMDAPGFTPSLGELWGRRWNSAFSALARRFVTAPLTPRFGTAASTFAAFLASGLVHELVLSVPARGGWGGPTAYFLLQGCGVLFERSSRGLALGLGTGSIRSRAFAMTVALVPLPLLLNEAVLTRITLPLAQAIVPGGMIMDLESLMSLALWMAVVAHACVLMAGVQLPRRLNWREELARLSRFNRKLMWVYHAFIGLVVVAFGALTAALHDEMMRGDRAAIGLAILIGVFWTARIIVDAVVYRHDDWPKGGGFVLGHALLVFAFASMAGTYWCVVARSIAG